MLWLWNFFLQKRQFSYVLIAALIIAGAFALLRIPKENYPAIVIPDGFVVVTMPGASAARMVRLSLDWASKLSASAFEISRVWSMRRVRVASLIE